MSIQAVAWALEQDFSYVTAGRGPKGKPRETAAHGAKLVLISLCNHADHKSGHCWPSAETIAHESSCSVRSVYRLIAALERNGFIDVKRGKGGNGKQRSNNYWIRFDREPAPWQFFDDERNDSATEDESPHDTVSPDDNTADEPENAPVSLGRVDMRVTRDIKLEPSGSEPSAAAPAGFQSQQRAAEQAKLQAAEEARKRERVPVIEGSKPWLSWVKHGHPKTLVGQIIIEGRRDRGWYFPTLYPQPATGPPAPRSFMSAEDEDDLINMG